MGKKQNGYLEQDMKARKEGPEKKKYTEKDLINVYPLTYTQEEVFKAFHNYDHLALLGTAGTGKTFLAMYLGLREVFLSHHRNLVVVRSATPSKDIGFLPGTLEEKLEVYEEPYRAICADLLERETAYDNLKKRDYVQFTSTSFLRGNTMDDAVIVIDEAQNLTMSELNTIMTRVGENSRIFICGDIAQSDLDKRKQAPWAKFVNAIDSIPSFETVYFCRDDIVRSDIVREWIIATEDYQLLET